MRRVAVPLLASLGATLTLILAAAASQILRSPDEVLRTRPPSIAQTLSEGSYSQGVIETRPKRHTARAILAVHDEWSNGARIAADYFDRHCPDGPLQDGEITAFSEAIGSLGFDVEVRQAGELTGDEDVSLVIYHNGGWGSQLGLKAQQSLSRLYERGVPLLFAGDDAAMMVNPHPAMRELLGIEQVYGNGDYPSTVAIGGALVRYEKEPDSVRLAPDARVLATADGTPAAWIAPRGKGAPVAVFDLGIRASDICPLAPRGEEALLRSLLRDLAVEITASG